MEEIKVRLLNYDLPVDITNREDLDCILRELISLGGSELYVDGGQNIFLQVHGNNYKVGNRKITNSEAEQILGVINGEGAISKLMGGTPDNPSYEVEEIKEVDGHMRSIRHRFRVNAVMTQRKGRRSIAITMRAINHEAARYYDIGVSDEEIRKLKHIGHGLGLVIGPTGSGKTTLLSAVIRELLGEDNHVVTTIEQPIEYDYDNIDTDSSRVRQMEVGKDIDSFLDGVENCMRMKPTHIVIGESRDYQTISAAAESALTGHGVLTTVHAGKISEAIDRMIMRYPPALRDQAKLDIVSILKFACAQRLVPSSDGKRIAIRELLFFNDSMRKRIINAPMVALEVDSIVEEKKVSFAHDLKAKLEKGLITENVYKNELINLYGEE